MKVGIVIVSYNRPEYFKQCLDSFKGAAIPTDSVVVLIDDCSTDGKTIEYFNSFHLSGINVQKIRNTTNKKIAANIKLGFELCFLQSCEVVMNFDSDAIIKPDAIEKLVKVKDSFPIHIVTGFNCITKNLDGTERHKILHTGNGYNTKKSVGGINFVIQEQQYKKYVLPALTKSIEHSGNWDHMSCINSEKDGNSIICITPSVVQHIGYVSSMGHSGIEPPDIADDFSDKLRLEEVTLIGVDCMDLNRLIKARDICIKDVEFGAVKLLSSKPSFDPTVIKIPDIRNKEEYSNFIMKELYKYVDTLYCLIFQYDGVVVDAKRFKLEFLTVDYIGATWWRKDNMNVGNGGFSLRSKKLMQICATDPNIKEFHPEDDKICRKYRKYLEKEHEIKFATEEMANEFAIEGHNVPYPDNVYSGQFGVHGNHIQGTPIYKSLPTNRGQRIRYM